MNKEWLREIGSVDSTAGSNTQGDSREMYVRSGGRVSLDYRARRAGELKKRSVRKKGRYMRVSRVSCFQVRWLLLDANTTAKAGQRKQGEGQVRSVAGEGMKE